MLAVPIPFVNTAIGYFPLIGFLIVLLLSWLYLRVLVAGLDFDQRGVGEGCTRGDFLKFEFVVSNRSILPAVSLGVLFFISDLFGGERESSRRSVGLPPRSSKTYDFAVRFDHIGTYGVGIREIDVSDPFGIFHKVQTFPELKSISVQPRIYDALDLEISTEASKESNRSVVTVIDDGMDYCGVREYRWGDPIKAIHWNLSSRIPEGEYFTRLYETSCNPGLAILVDCESPDFTAEQLMSAYDGIVEAALSIEKWASSNAYESELLFVDRTSRRRRFEGPLAGRFDDILRRLPRISRGDGATLLEMLHSEAASIYAQDNLIVCTSNVTDELVGEMMRVKAGHHSPALIAVLPDGVERELAAKVQARVSRLAGAGINVAVLSEASELERGA